MGPCRLSKLRLVEVITRSPGPKLSPPAKKHMEQPASRHSKPAALNTASNPSASACAFTAVEPGTQIARTPGATLRPRSRAAARRRSGRRLLVQEPMKAASIFSPCSGWPGSRPM